MHRIVELPLNASKEDSSFFDLKTNLDQVKANISNVSRSSGRSIDAVTLSSRI